MNPKSEAVRKVAKLFGEMKGRISMGANDVRERDGECLACHAGYYLVANLNKETPRSKSYEWVDAESILGPGRWISRRDLRYKGSRAMVDYHKGTRDLANDLGFRDGRYLTQWAHENRDIWGNVFGSMMFYSAKAFGCLRDDSYLTVEDVAAHWKEVADRLERIENATPIS